MFIQIKFWPYVLEAFVGAAVAFAAAMAATHALAKSGKIQLADGEPKHVFTVEALCLPYPRRAGASRKSGTPQRIQQAPAAVPPGPAPPANAELHGFVQGRRRIAEAVVCPFCGDSRVKGKVPVPRQCRLCQRKISILVEREDGQRCAVCHGILVWGASFCHHCGSLQQEKA